MVEDLVSTIIPVHNRPSLVEDAVLSVLEQEYRPVEVIIVDDGSTDETVGAVERLARERTEVRSVRIPNSGPGRAREVGRRLAGGEFIQYLDSDDVLLPLKFARQVKALRSFPDTDVCYGKTRFVHQDGERMTRPWKRTGERVRTMFPSFLVERWWGTSTPLYRARVTERAGPWTELRTEEDWEYDCRIAALKVRLCYVPHFVSEERDHSGDRLSRGGSVEPRKLRDRTLARELILGHARRGGMTSMDPEMQSFARGLFLLCRQCGAAGLDDESRRLLELARSAAGSSGGKRADFILYAGLAGLIGWSRLGKLACWSDQFRRTARQRVPD